MYNFTWIPAFVSVMVVIWEGTASWKEKTFAPFQKNCRKIKLFFIFHGGVVAGDLFILSYLYCIWAGHFSIPWWLWVEFFPISFAITWKCHRAWWDMCKDQPGFMYPDRNESGGDPALWYRDLPDSAWIHVAYMTGSIMMIGGYIFSAMPSDIVWRTFWAFMLFVPLAIIEPGIVQGWPLKRKDVMISIGSAIALWALVGLVTWLKLIHFWIL
jgi:hypothetical protein